MRDSRTVGHQAETSQTVLFVMISMGSRAIYVPGLNVERRSRELFCKLVHLHELHPTRRSIKKMGFFPHGSLGPRLVPKAPTPMPRSNVRQARLLLVS